MRQSYYAIYSLSIKAIVGLTSEPQAIMHREDSEKIRLIKITKKEFDTFDAWGENDKNPRYQEIAARTKLKPIWKFALVLDY